MMCAYSFASLRGEQTSVATLTHSMLVGSGLSVCIVAVLGGFEALARAFLPDSAVVFLVVCASVAAAAPAFVWFPHMDIIQNYGPSLYPGPPRAKEDAARLIRRLFLVGLAAAAGGVALQSVGVLGDPRHWEYLAITFVGSRLHVGNGPHRPLGVDADRTRPTERRAHVGVGARPVGDDLRDDRAAALIHAGSGLPARGRPCLAGADISIC